MSHPYPPPGGYSNEPINYNYGATPVNPRPSAVTVLAVFGIILASFGLLAQLCGGLGVVFQLAGFQQLQTTTFPTTTASTLPTGTSTSAVWASSGGVPKASTAAIAVAAVTVVIYFVINAAQLFGSIGLLRLSRGARKLVVSVSIVQLVLLGPWLIAFFVFTAPDVRAQMQAQMAQQQAAMGGNNPFGNFGSAMADFSIWTTVALALLSAVLPLCNVIVLNRARIKAAFGER